MSKAKSFNDFSYGVGLEYNATSYKQVKDALKSNLDSLKEMVKIYETGIKFDPNKSTEEITNSFKSIFKFIEQIKDSENPFNEFIDKGVLDRIKVLENYVEKIVERAPEIGQAFSSVFNQIETEANSKLPGTMNQLFSDKSFELKNLNSQIKSLNKLYSALSDKKNVLLDTKNNNANIRNFLSPPSSSGLQLTEQPSFDKVKEWWSEYKSLITDINAMTKSDADFDPKTMLDKVNSFLKVVSKLSQAAEFENISGATSKQLPKGYLQQIQDLSKYQEDLRTKIEYIFDATINKVNEKKEQLTKAYQDLSSANETLVESSGKTSTSTSQKGENGSGGKNLNQQYNVVVNPQVDAEKWAGIINSKLSAVSNRLDPVVLTATFSSSKNSKNRIQDLEGNVASINQKVTANLTVNSNLDDFEEKIKKIHEALQNAKELLAKNSTFKLKFEFEDAGGEKLTNVKSYLQSQFKNLQVSLKVSNGEKFIESIKALRATVDEQLKGIGQQVKENGEVEGLDKIPIGFKIGNADTLLVEVEDLRSQIEDKLKDININLNFSNINDALSTVGSISDIIKELIGDTSGTKRNNVGNVINSANVAIEKTNKSQEQLNKINNYIEQLNGDDAYNSEAFKTLGEIKNNKYVTGSKKEIKELLDTYNAVSEKIQKANTGTAQQRKSIYKSQKEYDADYAILTKTQTRLDEIKNTQLDYCAKRKAKLEGISQVESEIIEKEQKVNSIEKETIQSTAKINETKTSTSGSTTKQAQQLQKEIDNLSIKNLTKVFNSDSFIGTGIIGANGRKVRNSSETLKKQVEEYSQLYSKLESIKNGEKTIADVYGTGSNANDLYEKDKKSARELYDQLSLVVEVQKAYKQSKLDALTGTSTEKSTEVSISKEMGQINTKEELNTISESADESKNKINELNASLEETRNKIASLKSEGGKSEFFGQFDKNGNSIDQSKITSLLNDYNNTADASNKITQTINKQKAYLEQSINERKDEINKIRQENKEKEKLATATPVNIDNSKLEESLNFLKEANKEYAIFISKSGQIFTTTDNSENSVSVGKMLSDLANNEIYAALHNHPNLWAKAFSTNDITASGFEKALGINLGGMINGDTLMTFDYSDMSKQLINKVAKDYNKMYKSAKSTTMPEFMKALREGIYTTKEEQGNLSDQYAQKTQELLNNMFLDYLNKQGLSDRLKTFKLSDVSGISDYFKSIGAKAVTNTDPLQKISNYLSGTYSTKSGNILNEDNLYVKKIIELINDKQINNHDAEAMIAALQQLSKYNGTKSSEIKSIMKGFEDDNPELSGIYEKWQSLSSKSLSIKDISSAYRSSDYNIKELQSQQKAAEQVIRSLEKDGVSSKYFGKFDKNGDELDQNYINELISQSSIHKEAQEELNQIYQDQLSCLKSQEEEIQNQINLLNDKNSLEEQSSETVREEESVQQQQTQQIMSQTEETKKQAEAQREVATETQKAAEATTSSTKKSTSSTKTSSSKSTKTSSSTSSKFDINQIDTMINSLINEKFNSKYFGTFDKNGDFTSAIKDRTAGLLAEYNQYKGSTEEVNAAIQNQIKYLEDVIEKKREQISITQQQASQENKLSDSMKSAKEYYSKSGLKGVDAYNSALQLNEKLLNKAYGINGNSNKIYFTDKGNDIKAYSDEIETYNNVLNKIGYTITDIQEQRAKGIGQRGFTGLITPLDGSVAQSYEQAKKSLLGLGDGYAQSMVDVKEFNADIKKSQYAIESLKKYGTKSSFLSSEGFTNSELSNKSIVNSKKEIQSEQQLDSILQSQLTFLRARKKELEEQGAITEKNAEKAESAAATEQSSSAATEEANNKVLQGKEKIAEANEKIAETNTEAAASTATVTTASTSNTSSSSRASSSSGTSGGLIGALSNSLQKEYDKLKKVEEALQEHVKLMEQAKEAEKQKSDVAGELTEKLKQEAEAFKQVRTESKSSNTTSKKKEVDQSEVEAAKAAVEDLNKLKELEGKVLSSFNGEYEEKGIVSTEPLANGLIRVKGVLKEVDGQYRTFTTDMKANGEIVKTTIGSNASLVKQYENLKKAQEEMAEKSAESKKTINEKNADSQIKTINALIGRINEYNSTRIETDQSTIDISNLQSLRQEMNDMLNMPADQRGSNFEAQLANLTEKAKLAAKNISEELTKALSMENVKDSGRAEDFFSGFTISSRNASEIMDQMNEKAKEYAASLENTQYEMGSFNAQTNTMTFSLRSADGEVKTFVMSLSEVGGQVTVQEKKVATLNTSWLQFTSSLKRAGRQFLWAVVGGNVFFKLINAVRTGVTDVKNLDLAMTELKKVTDETDATYEKFLDTASKISSEIGSTLTDFTNATADFARLGYTISESTELAQAAVVYKNVGDEIDDISTATESIISTMKAFNISADDSMGIIDKFNEVGNSFAISSAGIGEALENSASALYTAGNTIDESIGLITAANSVVQDPASVGTAMKTLSLRIRGAKVELEEAGEDVDGMADSVSTLREKILALTGNKVDVMVDDTTFKNTTEILREMSTVWDSMTDINQAAALELLGGKRQANILSAIITNFDTVEDVIESSTNAAGSAAEENEKYLDSIQGKTDQFDNSVQTLWSDFLNADVIKKIVSLGTFLVNTLDKIGPIFTSLIAAFGSVAITGFFSGFSSWFKSLGDAEKQITLLTALKTSFQGLGKGFKDLALKLKIIKQVGEGASASIKLGIGTAVSVVVAAVAAIVAIYASIKKAEKEAVSDAASDIETNDTNTKSLDDYKDKIKELRKELDIGNLSQEEAYNKREELIEIQNDLIENYGAEKSAIDLVTGSITEQIDAIDELEVAASRDWLNKYSQGTGLFGLGKSAIESAKESVKNTTHYFDIATGDVYKQFVDKFGYDAGSNLFREFRMGLSEAFSNIEEYSSGVAAVDKTDSATQYGMTVMLNDVTKEELQSYVDGVYEYIDEYSKKYNGTIDFTNLIGEVSSGEEKALGSDYEDRLAVFNEYLENTAITSYTSEYKSILDAQEELDNKLVDGSTKEIKDAYSSLQSKISEVTKGMGDEDLIDWFNQIVEQYADDIGNVDFERALTVTGAEDKITKGAEWAVNSTKDAIKDALAKIYVNGEKNSEEILQIGTAIDAGNTEGLGSQLAGYNELLKIADAYDISINNLIDSLVKLGTIDQGFSDDYSFDISDYETQIDDIQEDISTYQDALDSLNSGDFTFSDFVDLIQEFPDLAEGVDTSSDSFEGLAKNLKAAIKSSPKSLIKDLKSLREQLAKTGQETDDIDQLIDSISELGDIGSDEIEELAKKYGTLADSIDETNAAQSRLSDAIDADTNTDYSTMAEAYEEMINLFSLGAVGGESKVWDIATEFFGDNPTAIQAIIDKNADALWELLKIREEWYTLDDDDAEYDYSAIQSFIEDIAAKKDILEEFGVTWTYVNDTLTLDLPNENMKEFANAIGLSEQELLALIQQIGQFHGIDWTDEQDVEDVFDGIISKEESTSEKIEDISNQWDKLFSSLGLSIDNIDELTNKDLIDLDLANSEDEANKLIEYFKNLSDTYKELEEELKENPLELNLDNKTELISQLLDYGAPIEATSEAYENYKQELQKIESFGLSDYKDQILNGTVQSTFGNIDMDKRAIIEWSDKLKKTYAYELSTWDYDPEVGSIDTVFGGSARFSEGQNGLENGVEIAFTPILQTEDGGTKFLSQDTLYEYINDLISKSTVDGVFSEEKLLELDSVGEEIGNTFIKGVIAAADEGLDYENNGNWAEVVGRLMHFSGDYGAIELAMQEISKDAEDAGLSVEDFIDACENEEVEFNIPSLTEWLSNNGYSQSNIENIINTLFDNESTDLFDKINSVTDVDGSAAQKFQQIIQNLREIGIEVSTIDFSPLNSEYTIKVDESQIDKMLEDLGYTDEQVEILKSKWRDNGIIFQANVDSGSLDEANTEIEEETTDQSVSIIPEIEPYSKAKVDYALKQLTKDRTATIKVNMEYLNGSVTTTTTTTKSSVKQGNPSTANGTANASGNWGAKKSESSLVGELGQEIVVRGDRWFTVGDNGAEFFDIKKGDIVFNHKQAAALLNNGYITSRGKALAQGTAYVSSSGTANKYKTYVLSGSSATTSTGSDSSDSDDEEEQSIDFIEYKITEIENLITNITDKIANFLDDTTQTIQKNNQYDALVGAEKNKAQTYLDAVTLYNKKAADALSEIPSKYREMAKNGAIAVTDFIGEDETAIAEDIETYREWAQKVDDAENGYLEAIAQISAYRLEQLQDIADDFENIVGVIDAQSDLLQSTMDLITDSGERLSESFYQELIDESNKKLEDYQKEKKELQNILDDAVEAGDVLVGSDDWFEMVSAINDVDDSIVECMSDIEGFQNDINDLYWDNLDKFIEEIDNVDSQLSNLYDVLSDDEKVVDDIGDWTDDGITSLGLLAQQMELSQYKANQYAEAIEQLKKDYNDGLYSEDEYNDKLNELTENQWDAIDAYNQAQDSIVSLNKTRVEAVKDGMQKEIDAYKELIDAKKELLEADQEAKDFEEEVAEKQKDIATIQKQIAALQNDNSASAAAKRKQLNADLIEAQKDLDDTFYDHSIETQEDALDKEYDNYEQNKQDEMDALEEWLEDTDQVVNESLELVQDNTQTVMSTILETAQTYGVDISDAITFPWENGVNAISDYNTAFNSIADNFIDKLDEIKNSQQEIVDNAEKTAQSAIQSVDANQTKIMSAQKVTAKASSSSTSTSTTSTSTTSSSSKTPTKGSTVKVKSTATNFGSNSNSAKMASFVPGGTYTVYSVSNGQALIGQNGQYTGWVNIKDLEGYAKGTTGISKSKLAILDELGEELVLNAGADGRLQYLTKGTSVIPADLTEKIIDMAIDPTSVLERSMPKIDAPHISNNNMNVNLEFGSLVHVDTCNNDTIPTLQKMVRGEFDTMMKQLNNKLYSKVR